MMRHRTAAANADRISRDDQRRRQLPALEFIRRRLDAVENIAHEAGFKSRFDDLIRRCFLFEVQDAARDRAGRRAEVIDRQTGPARVPPRDACRRSFAE